MNSFEEILSKDVILIVPVEHGENETSFKLRAIATGRRAGTYMGNVVASSTAEKR